MSSSGPSDFTLSVYIARTVNGPIASSMRRIFSAPLQFLPISSPVFAFARVPMSASTPSSLAAWQSSNSGEADAITMGRSRGVSRNHLPSFACVRASCQNASDSAARSMRAAMREKSAVLNAVRLVLPVAAPTSRGSRPGRPPSSAGCRRMQNFTRSTVESPS